MGLHSVKSSQPTVPCLDLMAFLEGSLSERRAFIEQFGRTLEEIGCVGIENSGISPGLQEAAHIEAVKYFRLPEKIKMQAYSSNGFQGYAPLGRERAKDDQIGDFKEFYHATGSTQPEFLWPKVQPSFKQVMTSLYEACEECMHNLLVAIAIYLGYEDQETAIADLLGTGNSILRILHYPPIDEQAAKSGAVRSAEHKDMNIMTLIPKASAPGHQIKMKNGRWLHVVIPDNAVIVSPSEILATLTHQKIRGVTHRVVNPPDGDLSARYSFPFFALPHCNRAIPNLEKGRFPQ